MLQENYSLPLGNAKKMTQHRKVISQTYFTFEQEEIAVTKFYISKLTYNRKRMNLVMMM